jgi:hypothetical protein
MNAENHLHLLLGASAPKIKFAKMIINSYRIIYGELTTPKKIATKTGFLQKN